MSDTKPARIVPDHPNAKTWNAAAMLAEAKRLGGSVTQCDEDSEGANLYCYDHPCLGESPDLFRSEVMAAACLLEALRVYLCENHYGDSLTEAIRA